MGEVAQNAAGRHRAPLGGRVLADGRAATPTVAFLDAGRWESFDQLAALIRRAGCRCVRVTTQKSRLKRLLSRLVFHEVLYLTLDGLVAWLDTADARLMWDFQMTDQIAAELGAWPTPVRIPERPGTPSMAWINLVHDKCRQFEFFADRGIPQPAQLSFAHTTPEVAVEKLGLPLVVKQAVSYGGYGVEVAFDAGAVRTAAERLSRDGHRAVLFQRYVDGDEFGYGCASRDGRVFQETGYRKVHAGTRPTSQAVELITNDDPALCELGHAVSGALGYSGMLGFDAMRDDDGRFLVIDLHPRPWGCFAAFNMAGLDFADGYLYAIGVHSQPPTEAGPLPTGRHAESFPNAHHVSLVDEGLRLGSVIAYLRTARAYRRAMGVRYWLETTCLTALHVGRRRPSARRRMARSA